MKIGTRYLVITVYFLTTIDISHARCKIPKRAPCIGTHGRPKAISIWFARGRVCTFLELNSCPGLSTQRSRARPSSKVSRSFEIPFRIAGQERDVFSSARRMSRPVGRTDRGQFFDFAKPAVPPTPFSPFRHAIPRA